MSHQAKVKCARTCNRLRPSGSLLASDQRNLVGYEQYLVHAFNGRPVLQRGVQATKRSAARYSETLTANRDRSLQVIERLAMLNRAKAAHVVAWLALKSPDRSLHVGFVSGIFFVAEKRFLKRYNTVLLDQQGPVFHDELANAVTIRFLADVLGGAAWADPIELQPYDRIAVRPAVTGDQLDQLTAAEKACLDDIWARYGSMSVDQFEYELRENEDFPDMSMFSERIPQGSHQLTEPVRTNNIVDQVRELDSALASTIRAVDSAPWGTLRPVVRRTIG